MMLGGGGAPIHVSKSKYVPLDHISVAEVSITPLGGRETMMVI